MEALELTNNERIDRPIIPKALIYEMSKGEAIYYRDYKEFLKGNKTTEELMGSSYLQVVIITAIIKYLFSHLPDIYQVFTNELGVIHKKGNWRALDIAVYKKEALKDVLLENKYLNIPPEAAIEIDTKADTEKFTSAMDYVYEKTDDLLDFGVKKVIWIFTSSRKIMIASPGEKWVITGWEDSFSIIENITINIQELINKEA